MGEKKIKINTELLTKKSSYVTYGLLAVGLISYLIASSATTGGGVLLGILYLGKLLGIIGLFLLFFIGLNIVNYFGIDRHRVMGVAIGFSVAIGFILVFKYEPVVLNPVEEFSIDARFRLSSFQLMAMDISKGVQVSTINEDAHPAIKIIGIDNATVNEYMGWPFSWEKYANLLGSLEGCNYNSIMFDIFFVDDIKDNYGILSLVENVRYEILDSVYNQGGGSINLSYSNMVNSSAYFSQEIQRNGKAFVDYSFERGSAPDEFIESDIYKERLALLDRHKITNVVTTPYDSEYEWVDHPEPPIAAIGSSVKGMGFANIVKEDTGVNRRMPLVIKWKNGLYPSIDLLLVAQYYGINVKKDVEVKLGEYIKIKNIPSKKIKIGAALKDSDIMTKPNEKREITIPIDKEGFMYIKFIGGPWSFPSHSFVELAELDRGAIAEGGDPFANMMLLTAMYYATGASKDIHTSPFGDMAGIEHHANALNTILMQDFLHVAPNWVNFLIYILIGLAIGFVVPRYKMTKVILGTVVFILLFVAEVFLAFNWFNYIHHFFTPIIEMTVALVGITAYKVLTEEENVKYIRSTFSKFVSKDVVNELMANPESLKLGGEKKEITVFFSDIRGFTSMSEALSPEDLVHLLNDYLSAMTEIVLAYKGTIDKYMGDAIMAFWGAPVIMEDHAYRACIASLKQYSELEKLQTKWAEQKLPVIDIGIGLNTGFSVAGNMGSSHRMDYTVMGDSINLGSRLEGTNKMYGTNIIISEFTYEKVKDKIIARELDKIRVKGKLEPVTIYELLDIVNHEDYEKYRVAEI
ncbi:MAG: adenylate/guanylate cyclase domain-containing protein [Spirochaetia bacterium]|nr:adenylate/guanylate cyclase domain-containing protein [Spirochaetia bacterium]